MTPLCPKCGEPQVMIAMHLDEAIDMAAAEHKAVLHLEDEISKLRIRTAAQVLELEEEIKRLKGS
jgi:hypothetical protein